MMKTFHFAIIFIFILSASCSKTTGDNSESPSAGVSGMVSSAHPLATEAGLKILEKGGNAFDAAVTIASTLST